MLTVIFRYVVILLIQGCRCSFYPLSPFPVFSLPSTSLLCYASRAIQKAVLWLLTRLIVTLRGTTRVDMAVTTTPTPNLVTAWLPVTTAYSAPAECSSLVWEGFPPWLALNDPGYGHSVDQDLSCLPEAATAWWDQDIVDNSFTTYLIGPIVCPEAYTTATTSVKDSSTFVACCPS